MNEPASNPNPLLEIAGRALGAALDRVVALDPATRAKLAGLEGRAIDLDWSDTGLAARVVVREGRLVFGPKPLDATTPPDLGVRASLAGVVNLLLRERGGSGLAGSAARGAKVEIGGDAELARTLSRLAERYEPDVERAFTAVLGDVAGVQLARALKRGLDWARTSASTLVEDAGAFVRDESRDAVARAELDAFLADVDRLRDDAERLAARVARLERGAGGG